MYQITVETSFIASHQLKIGENTENIHEHKWLVSAALSGEKLDKNGLLVDFCSLKQNLDGLAEPFIGRKLEDCTEFQNINASAENVAKYFYCALKPFLPNSIELKYVEITECAGCRARFFDSP